MAKALYVATVVKTHIMEFHIPFLQMLKSEGWETAVAARNDYENPDDCKIPFCDTYYDVNFARQPFSKSNIKAYKDLKKIINEGDYDIIHCHTPVGGVLVRFAARASRKTGTKVIYTAHGFHFYKGAPMLNWLIYFPIEYVCSFLTDCLITINHEDYNFANKHMHAKEVIYVPGVGIDIGKFSKDNFDKNQKEQMRKALGLKDNEKMILSVGELNANKNHEEVIRALKDINDIDWQYFIAGRGEASNYLEALITDLGLSDKIHLLGYRSDINELNNCADLFVFPSLREGLPVALMEAVSSKTPVVCSKIRGNIELVQKENCYSNNLQEKIREFLSEDKMSLSEINYNNLKEYDLANVKSKIIGIYNNQLL